MLGEGKGMLTKSSWYQPDLYPYRSRTREDHYAVFEACLLRRKIIRRNVCTAVGLSWLVGVRQEPLDCSAYEASCRYWPIPTGLL